MIPSLALLALAASPGGEAHYVDATLDLDGELLSWRFLDLDGDGGDELVLAVRTRAGQRELRVHATGKDRVEPVPRQVVPMLDDVLAWGAADVREEPGRELLLLTRGAVWSYSPTKAGYRDNVAPLVRADLIYDFPDPHALPFWAYVLPAEGRDLVLVPGRDAFSIWGPGAGADSAYVQRARLEATEAPEGEERMPAPGEVSFELQVDGSAVFLPEEQPTGAALFSDSKSYSAPALVDLDGDGWLDLVRRRPESLAVHAGGPQGPAQQPTRVESLPEDLRTNAELELVDLDGDRYLDLLGVVRGESEGFRNVVHRVFLYRGSADGLLSEKPDQLLRFEAAVLRVEVADVDGDGRPDLALRKLELPGMLETISGLEFTYTYLVYLGEKKGRLARRPILEQSETYDEESVANLAANREMVLDCDGDGIADLVEIDLSGRVAIRRLRKESSFLRGDTWALEAGPWKLFEGAGEIQSLVVRDVNGDGLGDVISAGTDRFTLLLSSRGGGR